MLCQISMIFTIVKLLQHLSVFVLCNYDVVSLIPFFLDGVGSMITFSVMFWLDVAHSKDDVIISSYYECSCVMKVM